MANWFFAIAIINFIAALINHKNTTMWATFYVVSALYLIAACAFKVVD